LYTILIYFFINKRFENEKEEYLDKITLIINIYTDENGKIPDEIIEVLENAITAKNASLYANADICLIVDTKQKKEIYEHLQKKKITEYRFGELKYSQKLPMIGDILAAAFNICRDSKYLCYINADINILYWFFDLVTLTINGHKQNTGFIINRKDTPEKTDNLFQPTSDLKFIYHPGFDCFVFPKKMLRFTHFDACTIGLPPVGALLAANMVSLLPEVRLLKDSVVTWHRGDGRKENRWRPQKQKIEINFAHAFNATNKLIQTKDSLEKLRKTAFLNDYFAKFVGARPIQPKDITKWSY